MDNFLEVFPTDIINIIYHYKQIFEARENYCNCIKLMKKYNKDEQHPNFYFHSYLDGPSGRDPYQAVVNVFFNCIRFEKNKKKINFSSGHRCYHVTNDFQLSICIDNVDYSFFYSVYCDQCSKLVDLYDHYTDTHFYNYKCLLNHHKKKYMCFSNAFCRCIT